jgi:phage baseplate assembly protein W
MMHIAFPYRVDSRGRTATTDEDRHLRDLVEQVLFTSPGERVNRPGFGTPILQLVFEPAGDVLATALQATIQAALQQQLSRRLVVEHVEVEREEAVLRITVVYSARVTGERTAAQFVRET